MISLLWISRLTTSVYTTRGIYALVLDLQREDKVWLRFPSAAGSSWLFPSGQLGSRQSGVTQSYWCRFSPLLGFEALQTPNRLRYPINVFDCAFDSIYDLNKPVPIQG